MTKKIKKSEFYKNKKVTKIDEIDVIKILVFKIEPYGTKNSLDTILLDTISSLDTMIMMLLDHYA